MCYNKYTGNKIFGGMTHGNGNFRRNVRIFTEGQS